MHVEFKFPGGTLMASDHVEGAGFTSNKKGSNVHLSLGFDAVNEMEEAFNQLKEGGKVTMELNDTFWGDRFGMLEDKYGFNWMFSCRVKKKEEKD